MRTQILLLLIFICLKSFTKPNDFRFHGLTIEEGLPQGSVLCIHEDKKGFIWFGTYDGLCRFDGTNIKTFIPETNNKFTINDGAIYDICEDQNGKLYIATSTGGLNIFDPTSETFTFLKSDSTTTTIVDNSLYDVFEAKDSSIWIAGYNGLSHYFPKKDSVRTYYYNEIDKGGFYSYSCLSINQDIDDNIWIGTFGGGLCRYIAQKDSFEIIENNTTNTDLHSINVINKIKKYNENNFLVATINSLYLFNTTDKKYTLFYKDKIELNSFIIDKNKSIWIATVEDGLIQITRDKKIIKYKNNENDPYSLPENRINNIYQDSHDLIWIGLGSKGISYFKEGSKKFYHYYNNKSDNSLVGNDVFGFTEDGEQNVWIATTEGVSIFDYRNGKFKNLVARGSNKSIIDNQVWDVCYDSSGFMWLGFDSGASRYSFKEKKFYNYNYDPKDSTSLPSNEIFCFGTDKNNDIWIGTYYGLGKYNKELDNFVTYTSNSKDNSSISNNVIWHIFSDSKGRLWIGTSHGLDEYDYETNSFKHFDQNHPKLGILGSIEINYINEDNDGIFWLSTSKGLLRVDFENEQLKNFGTKHGLPNQVIYGSLIYEDDIWFSSNKGLSQMNRYTFEIANYDVHDGIQSNEFNIATLKLSNGVFMFGGINGITAFHPKNIKKNTSIPKVYFNNLTLNGKTVNPLENRYGQIPIKKSIIESEAIHLSYKEKLIQIEFSAIEYLIPNKIKYSYKFLPNSKDWIELGNTKTVTFTNLNPGKYKLLVRSTNTEQKWCDNTKQIEIIIHPPFYKMKWVIALEIIIVILALYWYIKRRITKVKRINFRLERTVIERTEEINSQKEELRVQRDQIYDQKKKLEKSAQELEIKVQKRTKQFRDAKEKAEESDRLKSAFLANMSHEIRTPMNAIIGFSELLDTVNINAEERSEYIDLIKTNGESLLTLLNDILDISIIESGKIHISKKDFSVEKLVTDIYQSYQNNKILKEKPLVNLELKHCETNNLILHNDPHRVRQVLNNLIGNALKYTSKGKVTISFIKGNNQIVFKVQDTGIGIYPQDLQRIFDRFHKINDTSDKNPYRGGGLGLAISRSLVELMGGKIWVESEPEVGSIFYFNIPGLKE